VTSLLRDTTGKRSCKRLVTLTASIAIVSAFVADACVAGIEVDPTLISATQGIAMVGLGAVTAEHFSPLSRRYRRNPTHANPTGRT